jgi:hypothetical protein
MKKVGFEMFSEVYLSFLISGVLVGWGLFPALGRGSLARF